MTLGSRALTGLSDEELVARFQGGQANALEVLIGRYWWLGRTRKRFLLGADADDIEQERRIGLFKAARDFRAEHQVPFKPFAQLCVARQLVTAIKAATRHKHEPLNGAVSIGSTLANDWTRVLSSGRLLGSDLAGDPAEQVVSREAVRGLQRCMTAELTELEAEVLRLHLEGKAYHEISGRLGRQTKAIDNALQRIRRKIGRHLEPESA